jgi:hypothetical protein
LKQTGALGAVGVAALAGCSGDGGDGSDGGDGGDGSSGDGGDGSSGDGSDGGGSDGGSSTDGGSLSPVRIASAPTPTTSLEIQFLREDTDILTTVMNDLGYEPDVTLNFDELSLFLGGQADIAPSIGTIEAAALGVEQDQQLTAHALQTPQHTGLYVREGSDYDPEVAGSKQAAIDRLAQDDAQFGIGGFGLGTIPAYRLIFSETYGYEFGREGDFNVVTSDLPTLARLVADGQLDAGTSGPPYGLWGVRDEVTPLLWNQEEMPALGFDRTNLCISNGITRTDFSEENAEAVAAWFGLESFAHEYIGSNISEFASRSAVQDNLNVPSQEAAEYVLNFRYNAEHSPNQLPASLADNGWTEERIQGDQDALSRAEEFGAVPSGWEENLSYQIHDLQQYADMAREMV